MTINKNIIPIILNKANGILAANVLISPKIKNEKLIIQNNNGEYSSKMFPFNFKSIQFWLCIASLAIKTYFVSS